MSLARTSSTLLTMGLDFALAFPFALLFTDGLGGVMPAQGSALSACTGGGVSLPTSSSPSSGEKLRGVAGAGGPLARSAADSSSTLPSSPPSDMEQLVQQLLVGAQPAVADEFQSAQRPRAEKRCANACAEEGWVDWLSSTLPAEGSALVADLLSS